MTILNTWTEKEFSISDMIIVFLVSAVVIFVAVYAILTVFCLSDSVPLYIGIGVVLLFLAITIPIGITNYSTCKDIIHIECTLDDSVSANYIFDKYEFKEKRGDIYILTTMDSEDGV